MTPYQVIRPQGQALPVLLSVPHCGTEFPAEIKDEFFQELITAPDDTDWFVHQLYDFAPSMGITLLHSTYSRWVVDLNRHPESKPLYSDGRIITAACPTTDFLGNPLYKDHRKVVAAAEMARRVELYYRPYHEKIAALLTELRTKYHQVLLWDCHSIRHLVPTIRAERFPDLILGDADGTAASPGMSETALRCLEQGNWKVSHNHPFKGGYITRHFGKPMDGIHALQLEMNKINYMDDSETRYDEVRAERVRDVLKSTLQTLADQLLEADHD